MRVVGIDTGGTFTDFVAFDDGDWRLHKELSTPAEPERAILRGLAALGLEVAGLRIVHGSTVATNAVLEGKGAKTLFVTNHGLGDLLTIGRQARPDLYDLSPTVVAPPVPPERCIEVGGRLAADGTTVSALEPEDEQRLLAAVAEHRPEAIAITLLFSFLDGEFERRLEAILPSDCFVSCSHRVLPEYREYERATATWLNAYVGPVMRGYLERLARGCDGARLSVMQSSGLTCDAGFAGARGVNLLLSGPAGGVEGAGRIAALAGFEQVLSFDMGGTSTDVALIDGEPRLTSEGTIGRYPVAVPMVDIHTIGAGGGSIARVDAGGLLQVGPESAGAEPGPACYGAGGTEPTVTDANLVLGHLPADVRLGGRMALDRAAAERAVAALASSLGADSVGAAAAGIIAIANEHMAQALRVISIERGIDPRGFVLVAFGGAGGLHLCALAAALGIRQALAPAAAGVLSAFGMVSAKPGRQLSRTVRMPLAEAREAQLAVLFEELEASGGEALAAEGFEPEAIRSRRALDVCYVGQSFTLTVPLEPWSEVANAFHAAHADRYGHQLDVPVEIVNLRVTLDCDSGRVVAPTHQPREAPAPGRTAVVGIDWAVPVVARHGLQLDARVEGPMVVTDDIGTTWIAPGWHGRLDRYGNLLLHQES